MKSVKVAKIELLAKLKDNMEKHIVAYNEAIIGYSKEAEKYLKSKLKDLKKNPETSIIDNHRINDLGVPSSHEKNYRNVIAMLEMSTEDTIEIDELSFKRYVMDEWEWKQSFVTSNSKYLSK